MATGLVRSAAEPIRAAATVCRYCNRNVVTPPDAQQRGPGSHSVDSPPAAVAPPVPVAARSEGTRNAVAAVALFALILILVWVIRQQKLKSATGQTSASDVATATGSGDALVPSQPVAPPPRPVVVPLLNGNLEVGPGQIRWFNLTVPDSATEAAVVGEFHTFGGAGNDIQVVLTTPFEFENWKNGHATRLFYNSGKVTNAVISVPNLAAGQYVLAFDNRFSIRSRKEITGKIPFGYKVP